MAKATKIERPYTVKEVAMLLRICPEMVRKHLVAGEIKGTKIGARWFIPSDEVKRICIANYEENKNENH